MTGSLYIPGHLCEQSHVTVEIGTGFFVKKTIPEAKTFVSNKITDLEKFTEQLGESLFAQTQNLRQIEGVMRKRVQDLKEQEGN